MGSYQRENYVILRTRLNNPLLLAPTFLLMVALFLVWNVVTKNNEFWSYQQKIAKQSVNGAANEISLTIRGLRTSLDLFARGHQDLLRQFARDPDDGGNQYMRITQLLSRYFPNYHAFTLANVDGEVIYDDFGEKIGEACRTDIRNYVTGDHQAEVYIHPGPGEYHFDIMLPWKQDSQNTGVFFVSFTPEVVTRLLNISEISQHQLILLRTDIEALIEITSKGGRNGLKRAIHISDEEKKRLLYSLPVELTRWNLVDLPDESLFASYWRQTRNQNLFIFALFIIVSALMLHFIRREENRRAAAERALQESHGQLEKRVTQRTQEVVLINDNLQREIDVRIQTEQKIRRLSRVVEQTDDTVLITNRNGIAEYVNPAYEQKTGYCSDEILGKKPNIVKSDMHDKEFYKKLWNTILDEKTFRDVFINRRKDGSLYYEEKTITPIKNEQGVVTHFVATGKDITERMEAQERYQHLAHHDALTDLPNRILLLDRMQHALAQALRSDWLVAVLFLDLDRFKTINDSLGHSIGDKLLMAVTKRLQQCLRESDSIARIGGDEFSIILENIHEIHDVTVVAKKILGTIAQPFLIEEYEVYVTVSIGITMFPFDDDDIESLLKNADTTMYRAKASGGNTFEFFTAEMSKDVAKRMAMENRLRHALEQDEFVLHYQPRVDIRSGRITGAEALLRWHDKESGLVSPVEFIPMLEETGLILEVGEWVIRTACRDFKALENFNQSPLKVAVNLSCKQFQQKNLVEIIKNILNETGFTPNRLDLEITESLLVENIEMTVKILNKLHGMGIDIAIDDFGTGYSSLSYLKRFPIDHLKIDRSFIMDIANNEADTKLVKAIIAMAHSLRMDVVAEGIETSEQLEILRNLNCEEIQGYYFSRPLPLNEFINWCHNSKMIISEKIIVETKDEGIACSLRPIF